MLLFPSILKVVSTAFIDRVNVGAGGNQENSKADCKMHLIHWVVGGEIESGTQENGADWGRGRIMILVLNRFGWRCLLDASEKRVIRWEIHDTEVRRGSELGFKFGNHQHIDVIYSNRKRMSME